MIDALGKVVLYNYAKKQNVEELSDEELFEVIEKIAREYRKRGIRLSLHLTNSGLDGYAVNNSIIRSVLKNVRGLNKEGLVNAINSYFKGKTGKDYNFVFDALEDYYDELGEELEEIAKKLNTNNKDELKKLNKQIKTIVEYAILPVSLYRLARENIKVDATNSYLLTGYVRTNLYPTVPLVDGKVLFYQALVIPYLFRVSAKDVVNLFENGLVKSLESYISNAFAIVIFNDEEKTIEFFEKNMHARGETVRLVDIITSIDGSAIVFIFSGDNKGEFVHEIPVKSEVSEALKKLHSTKLKRAYVIAKMFSPGRNKLRVLLEELDFDVDSVAMVYSLITGEDEEVIKYVLLKIDEATKNDNGAHNVSDVVRVLDYDDAIEFIKAMSRLKKPGVVKAVIRDFAMKNNEKKKKKQKKGRRGKRRGKR